MTAAHEPERESTMSRVDVPVSNKTRAAYFEFVERISDSTGGDLLRYLDSLDAPSAHHRPRLNALLAAAKAGRL